MARKKGSVEITTSAILAVIVAVLVLFIVISHVVPQVKMLMNGGRDIQGAKYLAIQEQLRLCQAWYKSDFMDTVAFGVEKGFADLGLNEGGFNPPNPVCGDQAKDYVNCTKKCVALSKIAEACGQHTDDCYVIDGSFDARCDLEGCIR